MTLLLAPVLTGFGTGLSLIAAVGSQNAFLLRQGIRKQHIGLLVAICAASDAVLISLGVSGVGAVVDTLPGVLTVTRWLGVAFLFGYGVFAAVRALRPAGLEPAEREGGSTRKAAVLTCLAMTWLNPHLYVDILMLGSIASYQGEVGRWYFAVGAICASFVWFAVLGHGAQLLRGLFAQPMAWRILDSLIAVLMFSLSAAMAFGG